jgi:hypothetical protein
MFIYRFIPHSNTCVLRRLYDKFLLREFNRRSMHSDRWADRGKKLTSLVYNFHEVSAKNIENEKRRK